jgi:DNA topoisomerase-2
LLKPEHYLGDLKEVEESVWVVEKDKMVFKKIKYIPALLKLYDEILINAAQRKL